MSYNPYVEPSNVYVRTGDTQERRRSQVSRLQNLGVALTTSTGTITVSGAGETTQPIRFSVNFTHPPVVLFGPQMADSGYEQGNMPTILPIVLSYTPVDFGDERIYIVGADIGIVASGRAEQTLVVHWMAIGKAFRNPLGSTDEVF